MRKQHGYTLEELMHQEVIEIIKIKRNLHLMMYSISHFLMTPFKIKDYFIWIEKLIKIIYVFLTIFLYLLKCPQSLIL